MLITFYREPILVYWFWDCVMLKSGELRLYLNILTIAELTVKEDIHFGVVAFVYLRPLSSSLNFMTLFRHSHLMVAT